MQILKNQFPFIKTLGRNSVSLVGGEPTLNPDFIPIIRWLTEKKLEINVFSNGIANGTVINALKSVDSEKIRFYINRSVANPRPEVFEFYRSLGYMVHLAVTVYCQGQNLDHIHEEIKGFGLLKEFRIGIALPVYKNHENVYLKSEEYKIVAQELIDFFNKCLETGITPIFDCGFPFCFFNDEQKGFLSANNISFSSNCGIIPDIDGNNRLFPCFPLSEFTIAFSKNEIWKMKEKELQNLMDAETKNPLFEVCKTCDEMGKGNCTGGCLSLQFMKTSRQLQNIP
jgi:MoaA/NifB/PqqE/SkfB family radical SAM enzyme